MFWGYFLWCTDSSKLLPLANLGPGRFVGLIRIASGYWPPQARALGQTPQTPKPEKGHHLKLPEAMLVEGQLERVVKHFHPPGVVSFSVSPTASRLPDMFAILDRILERSENTHRQR